MAKYTATDLTSLTSNEASAVSTINSNFAGLETALENTLSRDGTSPNVMNADIDMNSNDLLNVGAVGATSLTLGGVTVTSGGGILAGPTGPAGPLGPTGPTGPAGGFSAVAKAVRSTDLTPTTATWTVVTWDQEIFDDADIHSTSTNTSRLVVPSGYTRARVSAQTIWNNNSTGFRYAVIDKNAAGTVSASGQVGGSTMVASNESMNSIDSGWISVTAGDYFELFIYTTSAATLRGPSGSFGGRSYLQIELV